MYVCAWLKVLLTLHTLFFTGGSKGLVASAGSDGVIAFLHTGRIARIFAFVHLLVTLYPSLYNMSFYCSYVHIRV